MTHVDPVALAEQIVRARAQGRLLPAPADHGLRADEAYAIQAAVLAPRMATGGGRGGWKLGYTSSVMREQMGVAEPNYGPLSQAMILDGSTSEGALITTGVTQPKVEPEIAAVLGSDVPLGATAEEVRASVASWHIALEVVDSVWEGYRFDWALNTADGSSAAFMVLGPSVDGADVSGLEVELMRNGEPLARGRSDAAMGDPLVALHWLSQQLTTQGIQLHEGDVIITGGLTPAVDLAPGDVISAEVAEPHSNAHARVTVSRA